MPYEPEIKEVDTDILILGGGMAGCGAAVEASYWAKPLGLQVTLVEKSAVERSGAVAMGLSAINTYMGMSGRGSTYGGDVGQHFPDEFVKYTKTDLMGILRDDLIFDVARHVDSSVHLFEEWGLPIWKNDEGQYVREGPWQIMINGESYKVIVSEAAKNALGMENLYERVAISHLIPDPNDPNRVAGAVGFSVREDKMYIFKAKAILTCMGGAVHVFRPRSQGEGIGRSWYAPWNAGTTYALPAQMGAELTQMDVRFIPTRYKDGYGPVGAWFLLFKSRALSSKPKHGTTGEYMVENRDRMEEYKPYSTGKPLATCLRNHAMFLDALFDFGGPVTMQTPEAIQKLADTAADEKEYKKKLKELESEAWEDFLDMTISQAIVWASKNVEPERDTSELMGTEPVFIASHSGSAGLWVCGPEDLMPDEYKDHFPALYNRMTTVLGLFTAGDGAGASSHKYSSGSFTEGRIAAKAACKFVNEQAKDYKLDISDDMVQKYKEEVFKPFKTFEENKGQTTDPDINPNYIRPRMFMFRLQKIMCEYAGGWSYFFTTNDALLERGLQELTWLKEDADKLAAENLHELMRCWENIHRLWVAEAHVRQLLAKKETRYPGYYYKSDYPGLEEKKFTNLRYNPETEEWEVVDRPLVELYELTEIVGGFAA